MIGLSRYYGYVRAETEDLWVSLLIEYLFFVIGLNLDFELVIVFTFLPVLLFQEP